MMATTLHKDLRREVYWLLEAAEREAAQCPASGEVTDAPEDADIHRVFDALEQVRCYSRAVQVFVAMVVEATLNTYGLLRFGEEAFERKAARAGPVERLNILLEPLPAAPADVEEIARIVDRVAQRRNALVHPRAELALLDDTGTFRTVTERRPGPVNLNAARAAVADMEIFLKRLGQLLEKHDVDAAGFLWLA
jgi:hypothetical protein